MATERELLLGLVTKAHNLADTEIIPNIYLLNEKNEVEGIKDTAMDYLLNLDAARVKTNKERETERLNKLASEKTAAINTSWENRLREGFGITDDLKGDDLYNKTLEIYKSHATGDGKSKSSKDYLELESKHKSLESRINTDYMPKADHEAYKQNEERKQRVFTALNQAKQIKSSMKLLYPEKEDIRLTNEKYFDIELASKFDDVQILDNGAIVPLKNGQRIENVHNNAVDFTEIVRETALKFWSEEKQAATGNGGQSNAGAGGTATTDIEQLKAVAKNPNATPAERWEASKKLASLELQK